MLVGSGWTCLRGVSYQTLVLMSDLATILDLQGRHDEALELVRQAVELGRSAGHPDQHVLLGNMAGILMHTGERRSKVTESGRSANEEIDGDSAALRLVRPVGGGGAVLPGGSGSGPAGRRQGGGGADPGGAEGGEEEEEPGEERGPGGGACTKMIEALNVS